MLRVIYTILYYTLSYYNIDIQILHITYVLYICKIM